MALCRSDTLSNELTCRGKNGGEWGLGAKEEGRPRRSAGALDRRESARMAANQLFG